MLEQADNSLVEQAKQGDQKAFAQLIEQNQKRIYSLAFRMTGNHEDALDVSQEAFLKAWKALPNFKEESSFSTWLYRLASNCAIDLIRKHKRQQESSLTTDFQDQESAELQVPDERYCPQLALAQKELSTTIQEGLLLLPEHHRQVLVMREISGMSYQEISTTLDLDLGTVKSRIARGRANLRAFFQKKGIGGSG